MQKDRQSKDTPEVCVSAILRDGTIVETLFDPSHEETSFVLGQANEVKEEASMEADGTRYIPYSPHNNLLRHGVVRLPSALGEYASKAALVEEIRVFIRRYCDLEEDLETVAVHYALFTWIYDAFRELPYLRVQAELGSGKTRFLLTVGSLCYKGIFASGASTVSPIFRILDAFRGTLILDEADFQDSDESGLIVKLLNNGHADGFPVLRSETIRHKEFSPTAFYIFGPKIVASRRSFTDRALESRCITFELSAKRPRKDIPLNLPDSFHGEATALRNKLLRFRFNERFQVRDLAKAVLRLNVEARVSQVFAPLLAIVDDEAVATRLCAIAQESNRVLFAERSLCVEAQVLEIIHEMTETEDVLYLKDIAARFAKRHVGEYRTAISPRWIGRILRSSLHLVPAKSRGNFLIRPEEGPRLRNLFIRYGLVKEEESEHGSERT